MTRDHDIKRAVRARMSATGERYTVARSALVAPDQSSANSETSHPQGEVMSAVDTDIFEELDALGFALLRSFIAPDDVARLSLVVDEVISATNAEKQEEAERRRAAGETGPINVWHPGQPGGIYEDLTNRADVAWTLQHQGLLAIASTLKGTSSELRRVAAWASMPGFGHQGLHPDDEGTYRAVGAWEVARFVVVLSSHRPETGTLRVIPGSHRTPLELTGWGSAMPPHPDEVLLEGEPGDVIVYAAQLWKSGTFNGGTEPSKCLLIE